MSAKLSTHVLDLTIGRPAAGVKLELWRRFSSGKRTLLKSVLTNADGRTDQPLLGPQDMAAGEYELIFFVGDYFRRGLRKRTGPFYDRIPVHFGVTDANASLHVPLLVTPWAYSTYRGS